MSLEKLSCLENRLVCACIDPSSDTFPHSSLQIIDWSLFLWLVNQHGIFPQAYYYLKDYPHLPDNVFKILKNSYMKGCINVLWYQEELEKFLKIFQTGKIKCAALKGIVNCHLYPEHGLREMSDVDLLIYRHDLEDVREIFLSQGYTQLEGGDEEALSLSEKSELQFRRSYKDMDFFFEIHWDLINVISMKKNAQVCIEEIWKNMRPWGVHGCFTLAPEDNLIYTFTHAGTHHQFERLKWIADILQLLKHYQQDLPWDKVIQRTHRYMLQPSVYYGLCLINNLFDSNIPAKVLKKIQPSPMKRYFLSNLINYDTLIGKSGPFRKYRMKAFRHQLKS